MRTAELLEWMGDLTARPIGGSQRREAFFQLAKMRSPMRWAVRPRNRPMSWGRCDAGSPVAESRFWEWPPSSRRSRPGTATSRRPRPEGAFRSISPPGTGCAASCRPSAVANATRHMETVEPVFGQIKQGRGLRQFLLRGLGEASGRVVADLHRPQPAEALQVRQLRHQPPPGCPGNWDASPSGRAARSFCRRWRSSTPGLHGLDWSCTSTRNDPHNRPSRAWMIADPNREDSL